MDLRAGMMGGSPKLDRQGKMAYLDEMDMKLSAKRAFCTEAENA